MDIEYSQFSKHILAASAVLFYKTNWPLEKLTSKNIENSRIKSFFFSIADLDINSNELFICQEWMKPFFEILSNQTLKSFSLSSISNEELYSIQTHNISTDLLENVYEYRSNTKPISTTNRPFRNLDNYLPSLSVLNEHNSINLFL